MATAAEGMGFDSLWLVDHLYVRWDRWGSGGELDPATPADPARADGYWESWSLLAALAAATERIQLGTMVTCTGFRNPALLAKMASTVDEVSGGRLVLGLGAGDHPDEFRTFGFPYDRRVSRFEEALQIVVPLLHNGYVDFAGEFYNAPNCVLTPRGPRPQGPPIMIGTLGPGPRMLRLVVQYADIWNVWLAFDDSHAAAVVPHIAAVDVACRKHGRNPDTLIKSAAVDIATSDAADDPKMIGGSPTQIAEELMRFAQHGVDLLQVIPNPQTQKGVENLAPIMSEFRAL